MEISRGMIILVTGIICLLAGITGFMIAVASSPGQRKKLKKMISEEYTV